MTILKYRYQKALRYIDQYWNKLTFFQSSRDGVHFRLPYAFVSPTPEDGIFAKDQFYWDTYFITLGLLQSGRVKLAKGMVDNLLFLFKQFGIIPSRNRYYDLGISQPPFLTSMALEIYKQINDKQWLKKVVNTAKNELNNYWMNKDHLAYKKLSRYCDHYMTNLTAEEESGWDMTSRFQDHCLEYIPIDLNSCLYKYEVDISYIDHLLGNETESKKYQKRAENRRKLIVSLMWDNEKKFFFDYNYSLGQKSKFYSLAGFYPLWARLASKEQALLLKNQAKRFEYKGGLANTQKTHSRDKDYKQWDYPNGWANQEWIVIEGFLNYGFYKDAQRIAQKWLKLNEKIFLETGKFWEKYNVVEETIGRPGRYPTQSGFGWTNAIFVKLVKEFDF